MDKEDVMQHTIHGSTSDTLPIPAIHHIERDAPLQWLRLGWRDLRLVPAISLGIDAAPLSCPATCYLGRPCLVCCPFTWG